MPLLDLPPELLNLIVSHLDFPDTNHLRGSCRAFASMIPAQPLPNWEVLVEAEEGAWARKRNRLACVYCARLLPATRFTDMEKSRSKLWRACAECSREALEELNPGSTWTWPNYAGVAAGCMRRRTAFSRERRVEVGRQRGVCGCCGNAFERWGKMTADRAVCRGCEGDLWERRAGELAETNALWRDLLGGDKREFARRVYWDFEWELQEARLGFVEWDWGYGYCPCCLDDEPFRGWREGWRGVNVIGT